MFIKVIRSSGVFTWECKHPHLRDPSPEILSLFDHPGAPWSQIPDPHVKKPRHMSLHWCRYSEIHKMWPFDLGLPFRKNSWRSSDNNHWQKNLWICFTKQNTEPNHANQWFRNCLDPSDPILKGQEVNERQHLAWKIGAWGDVKIGNQWILGRLMLDSDIPGVIIDYHSILQPNSGDLYSLCRFHMLPYTIPGFLRVLVSRFSPLVFKWWKLFQKTQNGTRHKLIYPIIKKKKCANLPFRNGLSQFFQPCFLSST